MFKILIPITALLILGYLWIWFVQWTAKKNKEVENKDESNS
jgi:hypothetical protein